MMMMKKKILFTFLFLVAFLSSFQKSTFAQDEKLEECQQYYQFGEVKANLNTKQSSYGSGERVEIFGTIINDNSFPLLNITVFAHLKRINEETFLENGHFLVDRLTLAQDLNFLANETKELSADFLIKSNYPQGQYQLQYFVFSKEGFYYSGRPFLEEDFAGVTNFEIKNTVIPEVFFDLETLTLDGVPQSIRDYIPIFGKEKNPSIAIMIKNPREERSDVLITYKWYRWDDSFEENLIKTGRVNIPAGQVLIFQTIFDLPEPGAYILLLEINEPARSLFQFRIARRGEKAYNLRMNNLGITNYPVDPQKDRAFVCFHSPSEENAPQTRVILSLFAKNSQVLEQKSVQDSFSGQVMAISIPLTKLTDQTNFSIQADFENLEKPSLSQNLKYDYHCHLFDQSLVGLSANYQDGKINLQSTNLCGNKLTDGYIEKLVVYQDGQIKKEEYNLTSIPPEVDTADLPPGDYKLLVKSGQIEKEMDFTVGKKVQRKLLFLIILTLIIPIGLISLIIFQKRKENET